MIRWTPDRDDELRRLRANGVRLSAIANLMGASYEAVRKRSQSLRIRAEKTYGVGERAALVIPAAPAVTWQEPPEIVDTRDLTGILMGDPIPGRGARPLRRD